MKTQIDQETATRLTKLFGSFILLLAWLGLFAGFLKWPQASSMLVGGLFMLLFAPERVDDERVKQLKLKAITVGYATGLVIVVAYENIGRVILRFNDLPRLSAFDALIILTLPALGLFHYWRWQDGRSVHPE